MMTRSMARPESPKGRYTSIGSQAPPRLQEGGIFKRTPVSPTRRSMKLLMGPSSGSSTVTQQDCIATLKSLLPKVTTSSTTGERDNEDHKMTELDLVERTIAYIAHLQSILNTTSNTSNNSGNNTHQDKSIQSTVDLLEKMAV